MQIWLSARKLVKVKRICAEEISGDDVFALKKKGKIAPLLCLVAKHCESKLENLYTSTYQMDLQSCQIYGLGHHCNQLDCKCHECFIVGVVF